MAKGGRRIGAGRKPKNKTAAVVLQHPSAANLEPVEVFDPPADLTPEARAIWEMQAPHAFASRTLTHATAFAFARYCQVVVLERNEAKSSAMGGANHRGLLKQINSYELQFLLTPCGKAMPVPDRMVAVNEDDAFFGDMSGSR